MPFAPSHGYLTLGKYQAYGQMNCFKHSILTPVPIPLEILACNSLYGSYPMEEIQWFEVYKIIKNSGITKD